MKLATVPLLAFALVFLAAVPALYAADLATAQAAVARKEFTVASRLLETITEKDPRNVEAWLLLGDALGEQTNEVALLRKAGLAKRSLAAYQRAALLAPGSARAHVSLIQYYMQAPFFVGGSRSKALEHARKLEQLDPWQGNFWLLRLAQAAGDHAEAFAACDRLSAAEPASYRTLYQIGRTAALSGEQLPRGAQALRQALTLVPAPGDPAHAHAHFRLGEILAHQDDRAGAAAAFAAAVALDANHAGAQSRLAQLR